MHHIITFSSNENSLNYAQFIHITSTALFYALLYGARLRFVKPLLSIMSKLASYQLTLIPTREQTQFLGLCIFGGQLFIFLENILQKKHSIFKNIFKYIFFQPLETFYQNFFSHTVKAEERGGEGRTEKPKTKQSKAEYNRLQQSLVESSSSTHQ